jgi:hypothetical protein
MLEYKPDLRSVCLDNCRCYRELRLGPCRRWCRTRCRKCPRHRRPEKIIVFFSNSKLLYLKQLYAHNSLLCASIKLHLTTINQQIDINLSFNYLFFL